MYGNSVRLRLRRSEVARLAAEGRVAMSVDFGDRRLGYSIALDGTEPVTVAEFDGEVVRVRVPREQGLAWCASEEVSLASNDVLPTVLIEKDFVRSAVMEFDDFDRFENQRTGRKPPPGPS